MTNTINNIIRDNYDVKRQIGDLPEVITAVKRYSPLLKVRRKFTKQFELSTGDSFVLGSATNGVLGTNRLGDRRVETNNFVFPYRNIVEEDLVDTSFINTTETTAEVDTVNEEVNFTVGEILESEQVAKLNSPILNIKVILLANNSDYTIEVTKDDSTWIEVTNNEKHTFATSSTDDFLKYRITATGSVTVSAPIKIQINK